MPKSLSALIIARDEERDLPGCLESLRGLADEIVVLVDEATTDRTAELARAAGATTAVRRFDDYARQRQAALELCAKDWVLWVDCDERPDEELRRAIKACLEDPSADAYSLRFAVRFLGRTLRWGGLGCETHVRLFRREAARFVGGALHEGLELSGPAGGRLPGRMLHEPYRDLSEYLGKLDRYTTLAAEKKRRAGRRFHWWHHLVLPAELLKRMAKLAFLDGWQGMTWAGLSAFHHWLKYVKLRELE